MREALQRQSLGEFAIAWTAALAQRRRVSDAIRAHTFCRAGGGLFYVMWGRRPAP